MAMGLSAKRKKTRLYALAPPHATTCATGITAAYIDRMTAALDTFPITRKWPARHPDRLQLYSLATPNGVKASIMLEETGLPYEAHRVDFGSNDQTSPEFLSLNPNNKIPAICDGAVKAPSHKRSQGGVKVPTGGICSSDWAAARERSGG